MPETENDKTVELDTSGPGARVELPETEKEADKTYENEVKKDEPNITYDDQPDNASEKSDEQPVVRDQKNEGGEVTQKADEEKSDKPQDTDYYFQYFRFGLCRWQRITPAGIKGESENFQYCICNTFMTQSI